MNALTAKDALGQEKDPRKARTGEGADGGSESTTETKALLRDLDRAAACLKRLAPEFAPSLENLLALQERLAEGRFHLAVLGQVKRGKSTLLNALIGEALLPTSVVPVTAIPTFIRSDQARHAHVHFLSGEEQASEKEFDGKGARLTEFLTGFVAESSNPNNRLGVSHVEVFHDSPILAEGLVLIDTPGIGSTYRHNTEATLNFLPQCDAALFLVSVDPPLTEAELEFLREVRTKVPRLFFLLNKVDYLTEPERRTALDFLKTVLSRELGIDDHPVFCVSARMGLQAREQGDAASWAASGLEAVEEHLVEFLVSEKAAALCSAVAAKGRAEIDDVLMELGLILRSLELPIAELEKRLQTFEQKIREAEDQRQITGDILAGELRRTKQYLVEQSRELAKESQEYLEAVTREALARTAGRERIRPAQEALAEVIPSFFERKSGEFERQFGERICGILEPHQRRADELIGTVRENAAELFDIPYSAPKSEEAFEMTRKPYWVTHKWAATLNPIPPEVSDRLLPASVRRSRIVKRIMGQVESLVTTNVENLRWPMLQSIDTTFRRFTSTLDTRLKETIQATHGAIRRALAKRREESEAISAEVERIQAETARLREIREAFSRKEV